MRHPLCVERPAAIQAYYCIYSQTRCLCVCHPPPPNTHTLHGSLPHLSATILLTSALLSAWPAMRWDRASLSGVWCGVVVEGWWLRGCRNSDTAASIHRDSIGSQPQAREGASSQFLRLLLLSACHLPDPPTQHTCSLALFVAKCPHPPAELSLCLPPYLLLHCPDAHTHITPSSPPPPDHLPAVRPVPPSLPPGQPHAPQASSEGWHAGPAW